MSNKKIADLNKISSSDFMQDAESYYTIVEREDGTLYKMLIKNALKTNQDSGQIVFLDGSDTIYSAGNRQTASAEKPLNISVNLSKYGIPDSANAAIITCFIIGGNYPVFDVRLGPNKQIRVWRKSGRAHQWSYQVMVPIENAKLEGSLVEKRNNDGAHDNRFDILLHGYVQ